MSLNNSEDSIQLNIDIPKYQKTKTNTILSSWQFNVISQQSGTIQLYFVLSEVYFRNILNKREQPKFTQDQKRRLGNQCVLIQQFVYSCYSDDGRHKNREDYRGQLLVYYYQYRGLEIIISLGEMQVDNNHDFYAKLLFYQPGEQEKYKNINLSINNNHINSYSFMIEDNHFQKYFKPKLAVQLILQKSNDYRNRIYRGINNEGNTCYMNSILQIFFFLRPIRKLILEYTGQSKIIMILQQIFIELMDPLGTNQSLRSVSAKNLLHCFSKFANPNKQQDIHQFLLMMIEKLEQQFPRVKEYWGGKVIQTIQSTQSQKTYKSQIKQYISGIQLQLQDQKGNVFGRMSQSLHLLIEEERMQDKIMTDEFGTLQAKKYKTFDELPNILFFNLKRYKFKKDKPTKMMIDFEYPAQINLGFLRSDYIDNDYILFGVAIHQGQKFNSGHYYTLLNTTKDKDDPSWIKFNDRRVQISSQDTALSFTGGKKKTMIWDKQCERFIEKSYMNQETAYILIYIKKDKFQQYQTVQTCIPRQIILNKLESTSRLENSHKVQILVLKQNQKFDPFDNTITTISLVLKSNEDILVQLQNVSEKLFGSQIHTVWKVIKKNKKIKLLNRALNLKETPATLYHANCGLNVPDYLLIILNNYKLRQQETMQAFLGILSIQWPELQIPFYQTKVICKQSMDQQIRFYQQKSIKPIQIISKDRFQFHWTDYCKIVCD